MMDPHDPDLPPTEEAEVEHRLRRALEQRAATVQPADGSLDAIDAGVAAERQRRRRRTAVLGVAAAVAVAVGVVAFLSLADDDESVVTDDPTTTTTEATTSTTTTTAAETTTTTTIPEDDDGVLGWPGTTSRVFDSPEAAALAFADEVLGFADSTLAEGTTEGDEAEYVVHPRPTAAISTRIRLHDTGALRGWVVTGTTSDQGTIDAASVDGGVVTVSGSATAFEATVAVLLLDLEGNVLAETFTMAGSNGEMGPYTATIESTSVTVAYVVIGAGDESGEGRLLWAAVTKLVDDL